MLIGKRARTPTAKDWVDVLSSWTGLPGSWSSVAQVSSATADGSVTDNSATLTTAVTQAPAVSGSGGGGGGGGALSLWEILALLFVVAHLRTATLRNCGTRIDGGCARTGYGPRFTSAMCWRR